MKYKNEYFQIEIPYWINGNPSNNKRVIIFKSEYKKLYNIIKKYERKIFLIDNFYQICKVVIEITNISIKIMLIFCLIAYTYITLIIKILLI